MHSSSRNVPVVRFVFSLMRSGSNVFLVDFLDFLGFGFDDAAMLANAFLLLLLLLLLSRL